MESPIPNGSKNRSYNLLSILAIIGAVGVAGSGIGSVFLEKSALAHRENLRLVLEAMDPFDEPVATIGAARAYLNTSVNAPDEGQVLWALSRYESALRRFVALRVNRKDSEIASAVTIYSNERTAALRQFNDGEPVE